jgi:hypothetical protein
MDVDAMKMNDDRLTVGIKFPNQPPSSVMKNGVKVRHSAILWRSPPAHNAPCAVAAYAHGI